MTTLDFEGTVSSLREKGLLMDDADWSLLAGRRWCVNVISGNPYVVSSQGGSSLLLHRLVMEAGPGQFVDHANGNTLDNRRINLRICTKRQNQQNSRKRRTYRGQPTKNSLKGAHPTRQGRWSARIRHYGKYHYLGTFATEEQAHAAYCEAAKFYHGEFARAS